MKDFIAFFGIGIFSVLLVSGIALAQDDFHAQIDPRSPIAGIQQFFGFDLPILIHSITLNEQALAEDRMNLIIEKELEQVALLDEVNSGQVDVTQFGDLNNNLIADISDQEVQINNMEATMPDAVDDGIAKDVMDASSNIVVSEVSLGVQADPTAISEVSVMELGFSDNTADSGGSGISGSEAGSGVSDSGAGSGNSVGGDGGGGGGGE